MSIKNQIMEMIDTIPDSDLTIIFEVVRKFVPDDYIASDDDILSHQIAAAEYADGLTVTHDAIVWD